MRKVVQAWQRSETTRESPYGRKTLQVAFGLVCSWAQLHTKPKARRLFKREHRIAPKSLNYFPCFSFSQVSINAHERDFNNDFQFKKKVRNFTSHFFHSIILSTFDFTLTMLNYLRNSPCSFRCEVCGKCFAASSNLSEHKTLHTNEMKYQCQLCDRHFRLSTSLRKHTMRCSAAIAKKTDSLTGGPPAPQAGPSSSSASSSTAVLVFDLPKALSQ